MCADQARLREEVILLEEAGVDGFHIDIMDGHFVPNIAMSIDIIHQLKKITKTPFDVHLMVEHPQMFIERILDTGVEKIAFHVESAFEMKNILPLYDKYQCELGLAINPASSFTKMYAEIVEEVKYYLIMAVNPGFAGQPKISFIPEKISELVNHLNTHSKVAKIMVDGHIDRNSIETYFKLGSSIFVGGSKGLFCGNFDYKKNIKLLKNINYLKED
jgi:ribulose-phosphate 3-epimerase